MSFSRNLNNQNFDNVFDQLIETYNTAVQTLPQAYHDKGLKYKTYDKITAQKYFKAAQALNPNFAAPIFESADLYLSDDNVELAVNEAKKLKTIKHLSTKTITEKVYEWYVQRAQKEMKSM